MKVALCLHGLFNSSTDQTSKGIDGYDYIKRNILDKFKNVDIYCQSWEPNNYEIIEKLYSPKSFCKMLPVNWKDIVDLSDIRKLNCPRSPESVLSHFLGVQTSLRLSLSSQIDYDLIIKSRYDLGRINRLSSGPGKANPFPVQCIAFPGKINQDKLYMANWNYLEVGPADMWFYGKTTMKCFNNIFYSLLQEFKIGSSYFNYASKIESNPGNISNSIAWYKYYFMANGIWDKKELVDSIWE